MAQEKRAYNWLTALSVAEYNLFSTNLHFATLLLFAINGKQMAHIEVFHLKDIHVTSFGTFASLLSEVCHDVVIEPEIQSLTSDSFDYQSALPNDEAHSDVRAQGFWGNRNTKDYFNAKVFCPYAKSYRKRPLSITNSQLEQPKRQAYDQRIREIEHGTFKPLVFATSGGMSRATTVTFRRLASMLSVKWDVPYCVVMGWLRCCISFPLTRPAIACLRNSRSSSHRIPNYIKLAMRKARLSPS